MKSIRCGGSRARESGSAGASLTKTVALAAVLASSAVFRAEAQALPAAVEARQRVIRPERTESVHSVELPKARQPVLRPERTASAYSVELPLVLRTGEDAAGTVILIDPTRFNVTLQTSVDLINNTSRNGVIANYQFSYTCVASTCSPLSGFYRTPVQQVILPGLGAFHQDDFVQYLATLGLLQPGADRGAIGTLLVTFSNLGSAGGWEANAIGTTYSPIFGNDPLRGSAGFAYNASFFFDSAESTLIGFARDTTASPTVAGSLRSDVGIRNTDILGTNENVTVDLSFYDTATGMRVGAFVTLADIRPGELRQVADVWTSAGIAPAVSSVIVFADAQNPMAFSPTIEGFVLIDEIHKSPRFLTMLCADLDGCGN